MSLSKPTGRLENPIVATLEWRGSDGKWRYYDGEENQHVDAGEIDFIYLDQLSALAGWNANVKQYCRSNEVHSLQDEILTVVHWKDKRRTVIEQGLYADIKNEMKGLGIKYRAIVYGMVTEDSKHFKKEDIVRFSIGGSALTSWIELKARVGNLVSFFDVGVNEEGIKYMFPMFDLKEPSGSDLDLAKKCDETLQAWLEPSSTSEEEQEPQNTPEALVSEDNEEAPF